MRRITVNLAPADTKGGALYDLPILLSILRRPASRNFFDTVFIGEVSLDGELRPINGALPAAIAASKAGAQKIVVPSDNAGEAALARGAKVIGIKSVSELVKILKARKRRKPRFRRSSAVLICTALIFPRLRDRITQSAPLK